MAEVVDFIFAAQMARQLDEFWAAPDEQEVISLSPLEELSNLCFFDDVTILGCFSSFLIDLLIVREAAKN